MTTTEMQGTTRSRLRPLACAAMVTALVMMPARFEAQLDICGCATIPDLPVVDSTTATYPTGVVDSGGVVTFTLPTDGVMRFSRVHIAGRNVAFTRNAANTPATILVSGDFTLTNGGCCLTVNVEGASGSAGNSATAGVGGLGGPGGFRGGDGASQGINGAAIGGAGFGPGGGVGGTASPFVTGSGGTFMGVPELLPLLGGSGGGGGASTSASPTNCSGGGGGGGGGGLLIAANGAITITNYFLFAEGGGAGSQGNSSCASQGGGGAGGAFRLVAARLVTGGNGAFFARGGGGTSPGTQGRIRLESIDTSSQTIFTTTPAAQRVTGPTPLMNPIAPSVNITSIGGIPVPPVPQGTYGAIDVVLSAPGPTGVALATSGVPGGTTVAITVKPRIGGLPQTQTVPLTGCDALGNCQATASFDLPAGAFVFEARATFQLGTGPV